MTDVSNGGTDGEVDDDPDAPATRDLVSEQLPRRLLLDQLVAERDEEPLPRELELRVTPMPVEGIRATRGRDARKRLLEVAAVARQNLEAAEEATSLAFEERRRLEREVSVRKRAESELGSLRRELQRLRETEEQRAARAGFAAAREARAEVEDEVKQVQADQARVTSNLTRLNEMLDEQATLVRDYADRLVEEQRARIAANQDVDHAVAARKHAEKSLMHATEQAQRRAQDELQCIASAEEAVREAEYEHDRAVAELTEMKAGGRIERLTADVDSLRADAVLLETACADAEARVLTADRATVEAETEAGAARRAAIVAERTRDRAERARVEAAAAAVDARVETDTWRARAADLEDSFGLATVDGEQLRGRIEELDAALTSAHADATATLGEVRDNLARARDDAATLRQEVATAHKDYAAAREELAGSQHAWETAQNTLATAHQELATARDETAAARKAASRSNASLLEATTARDALQRDATDANAGQAALATRTTELEEDVKDARTRATTAEKAARKLRKDLAVAETVAADAVAAAALATASVESLQDEKKSRPTKADQKTIVETKIVEKIIEVPDPAAAEQREALVRVRSELELAHGELGVARGEASDLEQIATAAIIEIERLQEELRVAHADLADAAEAASTVDTWATGLRR